MTWTAVVWAVAEAPLKEFFRYTTELSGSCDNERLGTDSQLI